MRAFDCATLRVSTQGTRGPPLLTTPGVPLPHPSPHLQCPPIAVPLPQFESRYQGGTPRTFPLAHVLPQLEQQ